MTNVSSDIQDLLNGPSFGFPHPEAAELEGSPDLQTSYVLTVTLTLIAGTFAMALRFYTKIYILSQLNLDDCNVAQIFHSMYKA